MPFARLQHHKVLRFFTKALQSRWIRDRVLFKDFVRSTRIKLQGPPKIVREGENSPKTHRLVTPPNLTPPHSSSCSSTSPVLLAFPFTSIVRASSGSTDTTFVVYREKNNHLIGSDSPTDRKCHGRRLPLRPTGPHRLAPRRLTGRRAVDGAGSALSTVECRLPQSIRRPSNVH